MKEKTISLVAKSSHKVGKIKYKVTACYSEDEPMLNKKVTELLVECVKKKNTPLK